MHKTLVSTTLISLISPFCAEAAVLLDPRNTGANQYSNIFDYYYYDDDGGFHTYEPTEFEENGSPKERPIAPLQGLKIGSDEPGRKSGSLEINSQNSNGQATELQRNRLILGHQGQLLINGNGEPGSATVLITDEKTNSGTALGLTSSTSQVTIANGGQLISTSASGTSGMGSVWQNDGEISVTGPGSLLSAPILSMGSSSSSLDEIPRTPSMTIADGAQAKFADGVYLGSSQYINTATSQSNTATLVVIGESSQLHAGSTRITDGNLSVLDGAQAFFSANLDIVSNSSISNGSLLRVNGKGSQINVSGEMTIGAGNFEYDAANDQLVPTALQGQLIVENGGLFKSDSVIVVAQPGYWDNPGFTQERNPAGDGTITIRSGGLLQAESIFLSSHGAQLTGNGGTVAADVIMEEQGKIAPGEDVGVLTIDGNFDWYDGLLEIEIASLRDFDQLQVLGNTMLGENSQVIFNFVDDYMPTVGDMFEFLVTDTLTSDLNLLDFMLLGLDQSEMIFSLTRTENGLALYAGSDAVSATVPLPAAFWLFLAAIGAVLRISSNPREQSLLQ